MRKTDATGRRGPRWSFMEGFDITQNGHAYLSRLRIISTPWFGVYLHHIHTPDKDPNPHDHPWWFASLILSGSYTERVIRTPPGLAGATIRHHRRWSLHAMPLDFAHQITEVAGSLWTLVFTGPRSATWPGWRFWTPDGPVDYRDYDYAGDDGSGDP